MHRTATSSWLRPGLPVVRAASRLSLVDTNSSCGDLAEVITRHKQERRGLPAHPGLARGSAARGLIDEYRLVVHPVVLGAGERLFPAPLALEPTSTTVFSAGAVAHVFAAHPRSSRPATAKVMTCHMRCRSVILDRGPAHTVR
jgi:hypothetical protein